WVANDLIGGDGIVALYQVLQLEAPQCTETVHDVVADLGERDVLFHPGTEGRAGGSPHVIAKRPGNTVWLTDRRWVVTAPFDRHQILERKQVQHDGVAGGEQLRQAFGKLLNAIRFVMDRKGSLRANPEGDLRHDAERAIGRTDIPQNVRLVFTDFPDRTI